MHGSLGRENWQKLQGTICKLQVGAVGLHGDIQHSVASGPPQDIVWSDCHETFSSAIQHMGGNSWQAGRHLSARQRQRNNRYPETNLGHPD